jgi:hypothetical protein
MLSPPGARPHPRNPCREVLNIFKGKQIEKGIAFPTCISANGCVSGKGGQSCFWLMPCASAAERVARRCCGPATGIPIVAHETFPSAPGALL